jgi:hypothetical protein
VQNNTLHKLEGGKTQKSKMIVDTNRHGIRRERYADWKPNKPYRKNSRNSDK